MKSSTAVSTRNEGMEIAKSVGILVAIFGIAVGVVALKVSQKTPAGATTGVKEVRPTGGARRGSRAGVVSSRDGSDPSGGLPQDAAPRNGGAASGADEKQDGGGSGNEGDGDDWELLVSAFDALIDSWIVPAKGGVSLKDANEFAAQFRKVPKARREECLQRAMNLIPDENVMLLAGILMDKSMDRGLVSLVFNDILNRDEQVKKPILQQIYTDREHPCWDDTAWIFEVTGEHPDPEQSAP